MKVEFARGWRPSSDQFEGNSLYLQASCTALSYCKRRPQSKSLGDLKKCSHKVPIEGRKTNTATGPTGNVATIQEVSQPNFSTFHSIHTLGNGSADQIWRVGTSFCNPSGCQLVFNSSRQCSCISNAVTSAVTAKLSLPEECATMQFYRSNKRAH
jgi:hypothetical protein